MRRPMKLFSALCFLIFFLGSLPVSAQKPDALQMYREKRYEEGVAIGKQEVATNPQNIDAYVVLCWNLLGAKRYVEAENYANQARKYDSANTRIIEALAEARYYQGKNASALEAFQVYVSTASKTAGDYGWAYYYMGDIYTRLTKYEHADIAFTSAVNIDGKRSLWWFKCGYAREMAGSYKTALAAYEKAISLDGSYQDALRGIERVKPKVK